jgi:hypothetical protein
LCNVNRQLDFNSNERRFAVVVLSAPAGVMSGWTLFMNQCAAPVRAFAQHATGTRARRFSYLRTLRQSNHRMAAVFARLLK